MPVLTDVHAEAEVAEAAAVVDVLQTPAFLCRQTDFIHAVARAGKPVNIKKGQFLAPEDMQQVVAKAKAASGADNILVCERGASFGYHNLVSDMRSLAIMRETGCPVVFDATHSVQLPGGQGTASGGQREFVPVLARAAVAAGVAGVFMETHPDPEKALSDGPNAWPLARMRALLETLMELDATVKRAGFPEKELMARASSRRAGCRRATAARRPTPRHENDMTIGRKPHECHRRRHRPRDSRFARQSHHRGRRRPRIRRLGPRGGARRARRPARRRRSSCATATPRATSARAC